MGARPDSSAGSSLETRLAQIVAESDRLLGLLRAVREIGPPDAFVGAGAVRDLVWDQDRKSVV